MRGGDGLLVEAVLPWRYSKSVSEAEVEVGGGLEAAFVADHMLGVADQVPPGGLESRVRRVRELVNECGVY